MEYEPRHYQQAIKSQETGIDLDWDSVDTRDPTADPFKKVVVRNVPLELRDVGLKKFLELRVGEVEDVHMFTPSNACEYLKIEIKFQMAYVTFRKFTHAMMAVDYSRNNKKMLEIYPGGVPLRIDRYRTKEEIQHYRVLAERDRAFRERIAQSCQPFESQKPMEVSSIKTVPLEPTVQNEPKMKRTYPKIEILSENEIPNDLDDIATFIINGEKLRIIRAETLDHQKEKPHMNVCATCRQICDCVCERCGDTWYCGSFCQKFHYPRHRAYCTNSSKAMQAEKSMINDLPNTVEESCDTLEGPEISTVAMCSELSSVIPPIGVPIQVVVSHFESHENFYIQLVKNEEEIIQLNTAVFQQFNKVACKSSHKLKVGQLVVAYWKPPDADENGIFYRAELLSYEDTTDMCHIRFIDYGNCDTIISRDLCFIQGEEDRLASMSTAVQAFKARWDGVPEKAVMTKLVAGEPVEVVCKYLNNDQVATICAADDATDDVGDVIDSLIDEVVQHLHFRTAPALS